MRARDLMAVVGLSVGSLAHATAGTAEEYHLGAGDTISIQVFNEPGLSREAVVPSICRLDFELIGVVNICGRATDEVAREIEARLADGYLVRPVVTVEVKAYGSQKVEIRGAVKTRGLQVLMGPTTLSQVITAAGGPDGENVVDVDLVKPDGTTATFTLSRLHLQDPPPYVEAGDVVILRQGRHVYVQGEVQKEGAVPFHEGLTVTQALSLAGGAGEYASLRRAYVLRSNGERVPVNIRRINEGLDADVVLDPDDQLIVRPSFF